MKAPLIIPAIKIRKTRAQRGQSHKAVRFEIATLSLRERPHKCAPLPMQIPRDT
jgi:hypothetical protein